MIDQKSYLAIVFTLAMAGFPRISFAQSLPPACAQLVKAFEACTTEYLNFLQLTNPGVYEEQRIKLSPSLAATQFREGVRNLGAKEMAERCASPEGKGQIVNAMSGLLTTLGFARGDARRCAQAMAEIR